jgi:hypothetical protein
MERRAQVASARLVGLAGLHLAWAAGSSWPSSDRATLSDAVIGHHERPSPAAALAVAGASTRPSA